MEKTIYAQEYRALLEWLRNQRKRKGLSMRELAARLNVHHSWIGRIEKGERRFDIVEFARLCDGIGCDPHEGMKLITPGSGKIRLKKAAEATEMTPCTFTLSSIPPLAGQVFYLRVLL